MKHICLNTSNKHHKLPTLPKFHDFNAPKIQDNSSNNITNYQCCQNSISYQHCPNYTMTKRYNITKMLQSQDYNVINHTMPQISTRAHNNPITISQHQTPNSKFSNSKNPKFSNFKLQIPNAKFQVSNFQNLKFQNFKFQIFKISSFKILKSQVSKILSFKFSKSQSFKISKF